MAGPALAGRRLGPAAEGRFLFLPDITVHAVKRLGLVHLSDADAVIDALRSGPSDDVGTATLAKVLISSHPHEQGPYINITLDHMLDFIETGVRR